MLHSRTEKPRLEVRRQMKGGMDNEDYSYSIKKNVHRDSGMRREMDRR